MTHDEASADAALSDALRAARAWLSATLASLPEAVTSLSVGGAFVDPDDRPNIEPRLRAAVGALQYPEDFGGGTPEIEAAMESVDALDDGLSDMTAPFLFALPVDGWVTVTREELAAEGPHVVDRFVSLTREGTEDGVLAAIVEEIRDLPDGEATTIRVRRSDEGALTWAVVEP